MTIEEDILARTLYGEARGEGLAGLEGVASVILNRVTLSKKRKGYWWGNTIKEVCLKPWQFSCWNEDDPNFRLIKAVKEDDKIFALCKRIARRAVSNVLNDTVNGATHYHHRNLRPKWSEGKIPCAEIGSHLFYNDIEE